MIYPPPGGRGPDEARRPAPGRAQRSSRELAALAVVLALATAVLFNLSNLDAPTAMRGAAQLMGRGASATPAVEESVPGSPDEGLALPTTAPPRGPSSGFPFPTPLRDPYSGQLTPAPGPTFGSGAFQGSRPPTAEPTLEPAGPGGGGQRTLPTPGPVATATPASPRPTVTAGVARTPTPGPSVTPGPTTTAGIAGTAGPTPSATDTGGYPGGTSTGPTATSRSGYP